MLLPTKSETNTRQPVIRDKLERLYAFLSANPVGVLATVDAKGNPHASVIYFAVDGNFRISFLTKDGTRKYDNLTRNPRLMLTVFEPQTQATAQITGRAVEVQDAYEVNNVAGKTLRASLKTSEAGMPPIAKLQAAGDYAAFNIDPEHVTMCVFERTDPGSYAELFETFEGSELRESYP